MDRPARLTGFVENDPSATLTESKSRSAANPDLILANPLCCPSG